MITAPMLNTGVDIDLPSVAAQEVKDPEGKLILSIGIDRKLHIASTVIPWAQLPDKLKALIKNRADARQDSELYIEADTKLPYGVVVTAMAIAKTAGVTKVMMLTDPSEHLDLAELDRSSPASAPSAGGAR
jgi:biopolymer transport protein TolR